jgi:hypothetical protein
MNNPLDLDTLDREKARAQEAFARGQLSEAQRGWEAIEGTYLRFGFVDGLVALRYNRVLAAVEADERAQVPRAVAGLAEALAAVTPPASAGVTQVAEGVLRLLPAALRGLDPEIEERLTRAALRFAAVRPPAAAEAYAGETFPDMSPAALAMLQPEDVARVLLAHPGPTLLQALVPSEPGPGAVDEVITLLETGRRQWDAGDRAGAYQSLGLAFERARTCAPGLAAELQIGLLRLEEEGLPERLEYTPGLPLERRLRTSLELHAALACGLSREPGRERMARAQWQHVVGLAGRVVERIHIRRVRGGGNAEDAEVEANGALWRALAHRQCGQPGDAQAALQPFLSRAQRSAFANVTVSARLLVAAGDLAERDEDAERATRYYSDAAEVALPGVTRAGRAVDLAHLMGEVIAEEGADRLPWAARALAGLARSQLTSNEAEARRAAGIARDLLSLGRVYLPTSHHQSALLWVELTRARLGEAGAADRAVELGIGLQEPQAVACALLYRARLATLDPVQRSAAPAAFSLAAAEASRGAAGEVRRTCEWAAALAWHDAATDVGRMDVHLRRYAEASRPGDVPDAGSDFDVCLPVPRRQSIEPFLERLLAEGKSALLHQLCVAERRRGLEDEPVFVEPELALEVRAWHRADFDSRRRRGLGAEEPPATLVERLQAVSRPGAGGRPLLAADEAVLSYRVAPNGTLAFVERGDGAPPRVVRIAAGSAALQGQVTECVRVLRAGDDQRKELLARAQELFSLLVRPAMGALEGVVSLQIIPDGPLWALPFSVLLGENFLCERFEVSIARHAPARGADESAAAIPARAVVAGDHATGRDLRLSVLERDGLYEAVTVVTGDDLDAAHLGETLGPARFVHLVAELGPGATLALREDGPATPVATLVGALRSAGVVGVMLFGPIDGPSGRQVVSSLLGGVRGGVLTRQLAVDEDGEFLFELARACAGATGPRDLAAALAATRRAAIRARLPARLWSAYELFTAEHD